MYKIQDGCWNCKYNHEDRCVYQLVMEMGEEGREYWKCCVGTVPMGVCDEWRRRGFFLDTDEVM